MLKKLKMTSLEFLCGICSMKYYFFNTVLKIYCTEIMTCLFCHMFLILTSKVVTIYTKLIKIQSALYSNSVIRPVFHTTHNKQILFT